MAESLNESTSAERAQGRLGELVENLAGQGLTQQQIAGQAGIPSQYLSDIKRGRRHMTELVARRLGEQFGVNYQWLLGTSPTMAPTRAQAQPPESTMGSTAGSTVGSTANWLPLFSQPIEGEPREHPAWDGTGLEVAGAAASKLSVATRPYILRFGHDDSRGRLRKGDFILISQASSPVAEISVVEYRKRLFLARAADDGIWQRVAQGEQMPPDCPIKGHCLGIVWSALCAGFE
jgi:transcriptional regulator with XRE-family HTH domain